VAGARVGEQVEAPGRNGFEIWSFYGIDQRSDADGWVMLDAKALEGYIRGLAIYALHVPRGLVGLFEVRAEDAGKELTWKLAPICRVHGRLTSPALQSLGRDLPWTMAHVFWNSHQTVEDASNGQFEFLLPPGEFRLDAYGAGTTTVNKTIEIK